jgi:hypothetical protein
MGAWRGGALKKDNFNQYPIIGDEDASYGHTKQGLDK